MSFLRSLLLWGATLLFVPAAFATPPERVAVGELATSQVETGLSSEASKPRLWEALPKPRGLTYGGRLFTSLAPDLRMEGEFEDRFSWTSGLDFRVKYKFAPTARFQISAKFRYRLRSGDSVESDYWLGLGDTYLALRKGRFSLRVGRMALRWGRNPLLSPLSMLSPIDSQVLFAGAGLEDPRIPVTAARLKLDLHPVALELTYIPFFQPARTSFFGRDFSLLRPGMLSALLGQLSGMVPATGDVLLDSTITRLGEKLSSSLLGLDPYSRDGLQSYLVADLPEEFPWHGDLGLRVGLSFPGVEADFYGLTYLLDSPSVELAPSLRLPLSQGRQMSLFELNDLLDPETELATPTYHRAFMAGADVSVAKGGFVITGEAAWKSRSVQYSRALEAVVVPSIEYALAVRYSFGTVFGIDVEFAHRILVADEVPELLFADGHYLQLAAMVFGRLMRDRLELVLGGNWNMLRKDLYLHPKVRVDVHDRLSVVFGAQLFFGFQPDLSGDLASLQSYRGGLAGYFRDNDYVYGNLEFRY